MTELHPSLSHYQIAALPTNTAMRAQVEGERAEALQNLRRTLAAENRMKRWENQVTLCVDFVKKLLALIQVPFGAEGEDVAEAVRPPLGRGIHDAPLHHALSGEIHTYIIDISWTTPLKKTNFNALTYRPHFDPS